MKLNSSNHSKHLILYHIVFCPKFRYKVLIDNKKYNLKINLRLKEIIYEIADIYDFRIIEMEIMSDHIHLFISAKPNVSSTKIVGKQL
jgi:putative transposase